MNLECFNSFILPYSCNNEVPTSGLYIDRYDGLSLSKLANTTDDKYANLKLLVADKTFIAVENIWSKVKRYLSDNGIDIELCSKDYYFGKFTNKVVANTGTGLKISLPKGSKYATIKVDTVSIKSGITGLFDLQVKHINSGAVLFNSTVNLQAGVQLDVSINQTFNSGIVITTDAPTVYQTAVSAYGETDCGGCNNCSTRCCDLIAGVSGLGQGITACVSLICSEELMICELKSTLRLAIYYQTIHHILTEAINTNRVNPFVLNRSEWIAENATKSLLMANEEIENAIKSVANTLKKDLCCIKCKGTGAFNKITVTP